MKIVFANEKWDTAIGENIYFKKNDITSTTGTAYNRRFANFTY